MCLQVTCRPLSKKKKVVFSCENLLETIFDLGFMLVFMAKRCFLYADYIERGVIFACLRLQAQDACGQLEIDSALTMVRDLEKDIQEAKASAEEGKLKPLPGQTVKYTHVQIQDSGSRRFRK